MPKSSPWGPQPTQDVCPTMWTPGIQLSLAGAIWRLNLGIPDIVPWGTPGGSYLSWCSSLEELFNHFSDLSPLRAHLWVPSSFFRNTVARVASTPTSEFGAPLIILKNHEWKWKLYFPLSGPYCGAKFLLCMNIYNYSDFHWNYMYLTEKKQKLSNAEGNYPHIRTYLSVEADIACGETHNYTCPVRLACGAPIHTNTCIDMHTL